MYDQQRRILDAQTLLTRGSMWIKQPDNNRKIIRKNGENAMLIHDDDAAEGKRKINRMLNKSKVYAC